MINIWLYVKIFHTPPPLKHVRSQEEGGFVHCEHFTNKGEGVLQEQTSALFGTKNIGFFKIYGVSARTRGVEPVRTFCGHGEDGGQIFSFFANVLYGQPPTALNSPTPSTSRKIVSWHC